MKKKKLILTCTLLGLFTGGVFASQSLKTQSKGKSFQGAVSENWAVLGAPVLSATGLPTSSTICMNTSDNNIVLGGNPTLSLNFSTAASSSEVSRVLNLSADGTGKILGVVAGANAAFAAGIEDTDYTYNLTYLYTYSEKAALTTTQGDSNLSSAGQAALAAGADKFFQTCGDSFVSTMDAGAVLAVNVGIKFNSKTDKLKFLESANLTANKNESTNITLNNSISVVASSIKDSGVITVSAIQKGGTPDKLAEIFAGADLTSCTAGNTTNCANLIAKVNTYATTVKAQVTDNSGKLIKDNLYYFTPSVIPYAKVGISVAEPKGLSDAAVSAQGKISDALTTSQSGIDFLNHYKSNSLPVQPDLSSYIAAQIQVLTNRINYIKSKAIDCFNAQAETCPAIVANIETTFKKSSSTYNFDKNKYGQLNSSWYYVLGGNLTYLVPVSFVNTFATYTTDSKTNNRVVQAYSAEENGVSYISEFDIPYTGVLGVVKTYKCLPASGDNKFANSRTFTCKNGLSSENVQFTKKTDSPL
jgi:hypothetical protein